MILCVIVEDVEVLGVAIVVEDVGIDQCMQDELAVGCEGDDACAL